MTVRANGKWQGMNWIRQEKRLAIYLRDGLSCVYCGDTVEDGAVLTLDHIKAFSRNGSNHETNLITSCKRCNSSRGNRTAGAFCRAVAYYFNDPKITAKKILSRINTFSKRPLPMTEAMELISRRGSASKAINHLSK